ncbi:WSC-domain-containing protein [Gymnopus androsaceus JB14]|uniref:WSC-domain-containing protein n=1 Tax=Gymnopus androsaceus JB14 TaxID=1447944 RepID=A0A6A4HMB2_9AGAR|nr:WSC-domain-containing protein [Gymnopus androsaceus JB14]
MSCGPLFLTPSFFLDMYGLLAFSFLTSVLATPALQTRNIWELPYYRSYNLQGCYSESSNWGHLTYTAWQNNSTNSAETCIDACSAAVYSFAALSNGSACYCGNSSDTSTPANCSSLCSGNPGEICGGPNTVTLYQNASRVECAVGYPSIGCYAENDWRSGGQPRLLTTQLTIANLTVEKCISACRADEYVFAGVEYGSQCFCGNVTDVEASEWTEASTDDCSMPCDGNTGEACGGGENYGTIIVYNLTDTCPSSGGTGGSGTGSGSATTTTATTTVIVTATTTTTKTTTGTTTGTGSSSGDPVITTTKTATTTITTTATTTDSSGTGTGAGDSSSGASTTAATTVTKTSTVTATATATATGSSGTGGGSTGTAATTTTKTATTTITTTATATSTGSGKGWALKGCYLDLLLYAL